MQSTCPCSLSCSNAAPPGRPGPRLLDPSPVAALGPRSGVHGGRITGSSRSAARASSAAAPMPAPRCGEWIGILGYYYPPPT
eukprot:scaffold1233_cov395-Prasinococcus_capsulatus_cf.AAC.39